MCTCGVCVFVCIFMYSSIWVSESIFFKTVVFLFPVWLWVWCAYKPLHNHYEGKWRKALLFWSLFFFTSSYDAEVLPITCATRSFIILPHCLLRIVVSAARCLLILSKGKKKGSAKRSWWNTPLNVEHSFCCFVASMAELSSVALQGSHLGDYYFCSAGRQSNVPRSLSSIWLCVWFTKTTPKRKIMTEVNASI